MTRTFSCLKSIDCWTFVIPSRGCCCPQHPAPFPCRSGPCSAVQSTCAGVQATSTRRHSPFSTTLAPSALRTSDVRTRTSESTACDALLDPPSSRPSLNQTKSLGQGLVDYGKWASLALCLLLQSFHGTKPCPLWTQCLWLLSHHNPKLLQEIISQPLLQVISCVQMHLG